MAEVIVLKDGVLSVGPFTVVEKPDVVTWRTNTYYRTETFVTDLRVYNRVARTQHLPENGT